MSILEEHVKFDEEFPTFLKNSYNTYNKKYFHNLLNVNVEVKLDKMGPSYGYTDIISILERKDKTKSVPKCEIYLNYYVFKYAPLEETIHTLVHEMIHVIDNIILIKTYYGDYDNRFINMINYYKRVLIHDIPLYEFLKFNKQFAHGKVFQYYMNKINKEEGRTVITIFNCRPYLEELIISNVTEYYCKNCKRKYFRARYPKLILCIYCNSPEIIVPPRYIEYREELKLRKLVLKHHWNLYVRMSEFIKYVCSSCGHEHDNALIEECAVCKKRIFFVKDFKYNTINTEKRDVIII